MNISIIGCGNVGSTISKELIDLDLNLNLNILDPSKLARAHIADLSHSTTLKGFTQIFYNDHERLDDADYIILAAALESTAIGDRLKKVKQHIELVKTVFSAFKPRRNPFIIVVTNPVDIITYHTYRHVGLAPERIIGTGTYLETLRFQYYLSQYFKVAVKDVAGWILGEHGNSAFAVLSTVKIRDIDSLKFKTKIQEAAQAAIKAPYLIRKAGAFTKYAIAKCVVDIFKVTSQKINCDLPLGLILNSQNQKLLNISELCVSIPAQIRGGQVIQPSIATLPSDSQKSLRHSAAILEQNLFLK